MNEILKIKHLHKTYNSISNETLAVSDTSFTIYEGEFVSLVGSSGCGKSTILNIIAGLDNDYTGLVKFKSGTTTSYMLQDDTLFPWLNVLDNALLGLKIQKKLTTENINYVKGLLTKYGLKDFMYKKVTDLSGGMKQRVALIRTLAIEPDILLLDEPFSALDYQTRLMVTDDIYKILKQEGITAIMVTHDISEAISMSDRVIVLSQRPATVKNIYNIEFDIEHRTPLNCRESPQFSKYFNTMWKELEEYDKEAEKK